MNYLKLTEVYEALEKTSKRLEKAKILANFLKDVSEIDLDYIPYLLVGRIFPSYDETKMGVSSRLIIKTLSLATGNSSDTVEKLFVKKGDLGETAFDLIKTKKQMTLQVTKLNSRKVFDNLRALASLTGEGTVNRKVGLISELLSSAKPAEAKFIIRTVLDDMRMGVGEGTFRDAIVWAYLGDDLGVELKEGKLKIDDRENYNKTVEIVQGAYDLLNDFSEICILIKTGGLDACKQVKLKVERPIKAMLYQKAKGIEDAFSIVGKPAALEYKYDGFRIQIHKSKLGVQLYTRSLDNVTEQFPDVVEVVEKNIKAKQFILDAEVIGINSQTKKYLPFQHISQRIKRKHDIQNLTKKVPVLVVVFDAMQVDNENLLKKPYEYRCARIKSILSKVPNKLEIAKQIITDDIKKAERFYKEALDKGNEGIMIKGLENGYKPGSRVGYGVKVKPILETLDLVIVKAERGKGKRTKWITSYTVACYDSERDKFLEIGKVSTGLKEKKEEGLSFEDLTELLKPLILNEKHGSLSVKPEIVIEVNYEEIQKSPTYTSGYALRFPRVMRLRDRQPVDVNTINDIVRIYNLQRGRNN